MKKLFLSAIAIVSIGLLAGCGSEGARALARDQVSQSAAAVQENQNTQSIQKTSQEPEAVSRNSNDGRKNASQGSDIGEEQAIAIALADAGVAEADTSYLRAHLDRDDGFIFYEIDFASQGVEYDYEIQASDGAVLKAEQDSSRGYYNGTSGNTGASGEPAVSFEEAKKMVLDRVPGASDRNIEMELEWDDGFLQYEGEVHYNGMEYEFEINGETGEFIKWHEDWHD